MSGVGTLGIGLRLRQTQHDLLAIDTGGCIDGGRGSVHPSNGANCRYRSLPLPLVAKTVTSRPHLYLALADLLTQALREGRYRPGDRLPSVRDLCDAHGMSLATVTHALHRLEDAGWIESRPRRGFFVLTSGDSPPRQAPPGSAPALQLEERRQRLMAQAATRDGLVSLGHLALPPALLPLAALRQLVAACLRTQVATLAAGSVFGSQALREQLAGRLGRTGVRADPEDVVLTHGDGESLQLCLSLLTQDGDCVAVASPGSLRVLEVVTALGLHPLELPAPSTGGDMVAAMAAFLVQARPTVCVIDLGLLATAAGPMSDAQKQALVELLRAHRVTAIEFDLMGALHRGTERARPLKSFDADDVVIYCSSLACITGPGFSLGYVVSARHRLRLRAARTVHGELIPRMTDDVLAEFLSGNGFDTHLRRLRLRLRQQVAAWTRAVKQHFPPGTSVSAGEAGYTLWVTLPGNLATSDLLAQAQAHGYTFVPGAVFSPTGRFDQCLRLTAAHPLDATRLAGLKLLGEAARQMLTQGQSSPRSTLCATPSLPPSAG